MLGYFPLQFAISDWETLHIEAESENETEDYIST